MVTVILTPVAFVFHLTVPKHPLATRFALEPSQNCGVVVAIVGAFGVVPVVITIGLETTLSPQLLIHLAV